MEGDKWLRDFVKKMDKEIVELRKDVKLLLLERAISKGKMLAYSFMFGALGGLTGIGTEIVVAWLHKK